MHNTNLFDQVTELKTKFKHFHRHKKQLTALTNLASVASFQHNDYIILIKKCMQDGFLGEEEASFLNHLVNRYFSDENFLNWTHKTKQLKARMAELSGHYSKPIAIQVDMFDWDKAKISSAASVPFELLAQQQQAQVARRAP